MKREIVASLIIRDKKFLLVQNKKYDILRIEPPGGKKHADEDWPDAVKREVEEELGVKVRPVNSSAFMVLPPPKGIFPSECIFAI